MGHEPKPWQVISTEVASRISPAHPSLIPFNGSAFSVTAYNEGYSVMAEAMRGSVARPGH